ncbi:hypothetical protein ACQR1W_08695 [Bradyrhizobium sp. HKCCYLS1011]
MTSAQPLRRADCPDSGNQLRPTLSKLTTFMDEADTDVMGLFKA